MPSVTTPSAAEPRSARVSSGGAIPSAVVIRFRSVLRLCASAVLSIGDGQDADLRQVLRRQRREATSAVCAASMAAEPGAAQFVEAMVVARAVRLAEPAAVMAAALAVAAVAVEPEAVVEATAVRTKVCS
jgi:hypothetical protein